MVGRDSAAIPRLSCGRHSYQLSLTSSQASSSATNSLETRVSVALDWSSSITNHLRLLSDSRILVCFQAPGTLSVSQARVCLQCPCLSGGTNYATRIERLKLLEPACMEWCLRPSLPFTGFVVLFDIRFLLMYWQWFFWVWRWPRCLWSWWRWWPVADGDGAVYKDASADARADACADATACDATADAPLGRSGGNRWASQGMCRVNNSTVFLVYHCIDHCNALCGLSTYNFIVGCIVMCRGYQKGSSLECHRSHWGRQLPT